MKDIQINAPHVIVQHVRFRNSTGDHALNIQGANVGKYPYYAHDVIIDHCSFSWGRDENLSIVYGAYNVTIQWCVVSQGIVSHSKGILVSGKDSATASTVSMHHNYLAHNQDRNPMIAVGALTDADPVQTPPIADVVNNVIYHWEGGMVSQTVGRAFVNWIHNYLKPANTSRASHTAETTPIATHQRLTTWPDIPQIFVEGNISGMRPTQSDAQWIVGDYYWVPSLTHPLLGEELRVLTRWPAPPVTATTASAEMAATILKTVGATVPFRDQHDTQMVADFLAGTGVMVSSVAFPDAWNALGLNTGAAVPLDSDNDGMPDWWEVAHGLDKSVDDSANICDGDGYTNIEKYLQYLAAGGSVAPRPPANVRVR